MAPAPAPATAARARVFAVTTAAGLFLFGAAVTTAPDRSGCDTLALTSAGWVCGERRYDADGGQYASFRGVPYARQPLRELRFQELQPPEPWTDVLNATAEGPVCPQTDVVYKGLQTHAGGMSEACVHANIHVPLEALPSLATQENASGLPILVFVHGGGFAFGSGDTDLHGPEYLVSKGVIVITFNYRLNVFGFLSLNSASIPGNNGLRDAITLLRWVRDNARAFGGDPDQVTLAGQSSGAAMVHLLTLSPAAEGLFQKAVLLSGVGNAEFFSTSPVFAKMAAGLLLSQLGIEPTLAPEEVHRQLVATPLDTIMTAHGALLDLFGLTVFAPVVESPHAGVTPVLEDDPDALLERGCGSDVPLLIGFTNSECETFRPRFVDFDIEDKIATTPALLVPPKLTYQAAPASVPVLMKLIERRYFNESRTLDDFISYCSDVYYKYPALRLAERRAGSGSATYLLRFAWGGRPGVLKPALRVRFAGAGHIEDLTYVFRAAVAPGPLRSRPEREDDEVTDRMTDYIVNFMRFTDPTPGGVPAPRWPVVRAPLRLLDVAGPARVASHTLSPRLRDVVTFFDALHRLSRAQ